MFANLLYYRPVPPMPIRALIDRLWTIVFYYERYILYRLFLLGFLVDLSTCLFSHLLRIFAEGKEEALGAHITHKKVRAVLIAMLLLPNMVIA